MASSPWSSSVAKADPAARERRHACLRLWPHPYDRGRGLAGRWLALFERLRLEITRCKEIVVWELEPDLAITTLGVADDGQVGPILIAGSGDDLRAWLRRQRLEDEFAVVRDNDEVDMGAIRESLLHAQVTPTNRQASPATAAFQGSVIQKPDAAFQLRTTQ